MRKTILAILLCVSFGMLLGCHCDKKFLKNGIYPLKNVFLHLAPSQYSFTLLKDGRWQQTPMLYFDEVDNYYDVPDSAQCWLDYWDSDYYNGCNIDRMAKLHLHSSSKIQGGDYEERVGKTYRHGTTRTIE